MRFALRGLIVLLIVLMLISGGYVGLMRYYDSQLEKFNREGNEAYERLMRTVPTTSPSEPTRQR